MSMPARINVKDLKLDLRNFRMVQQQNETKAVHAMIAIRPEWFWALTESLLNDGYHPTENIIVLKGGKENGEMIVREGNRRIGALKLIHGYISIKNIDIPSHIVSRIGDATEEWKAENVAVPCAVFEPNEATVVDRLVTLTHGKGERAGRDKWNAVARARHNRDKNGACEPALDLLEKYLRAGKNLTAQQGERWSGEYPLSVLDEAIKRIASRFGVASSGELADRYPKVHHRAGLDDILRDVGLEALVFKDIRNSSEDFAETRYGIPAAKKTPGSSGTSSTAGSATAGTGRTSGSTTSSSASGTNKTGAAANNDPKAVTRLLKKFTPVGNGREKLVTLLNEARTLKLKKNPHCFCFLLRSMFEISAKAFCDDNLANGGPSTQKKNGEDKFLVDLLRDIEQYLTKQGADKAMTKILHGAMAELATPESFLSVRSLNQLVHNPHFSVDETHISTVFGNIFPLLKEMNC